MVQLIYGRAGSGKTTLIYERLREDAKAGRKVLLLVPDQQVFESERRISENRIGGFTVEVAGFSRLCNQIFRRYGGLCYHYIGNGAKLIVMWRALCSLSGMLEEYGSLTLDDLSILSLMQKTIEELERCKVSPEDLERLAQTLPENDQALRRKLFDLSKIYALDLHYLHKNYDNPEEDLTRAAALLEDNHYFENMQVYVDGYDSYTPQESDIIRHILAQADNVTFTLPCLPHDSAEMFKGIRAAEKTLYRLIDGSGCERLDPVVLEGRKGVSSDELVFLTDRIWQLSGESYQEEPKDITLTETVDVYTEAEAVACEIARIVQDEQIRYRDIAVIMRSTPSYEGILDQAFEKYNIPSFSSVRTGLRMKPQIRLIGAALSIIGSNWRFDDVIAYLRSGLTGIDLSDCDLVEEYAATWSISGRQWYGEDAWSMNPQGFTVDFTDEDAEELEKLETIRQKLIAPLLVLQGAFSSSTTVRSASEELYKYLIEMNVPEQLEAEEKELVGSGMFEHAQECVQVWDAILSAMNDLVTVAGDMTVSVTTFSDLLFTVFDSVDIGKIPARVDEVILGDPGLLHKPNIKHVFLIGLCEGVFPAAIGEDTILSDDDRIKLELEGVELEDSIEKQSVKELYGVYRALSVATKKLHLYYHADLSPSVAVFAIRSLFPNLTVTKFADVPPTELVRSATSAFEYAAGRVGTPTADNVLSLLQDIPTFAPRIAALCRPLGEEDCRISSDTTELLSGRGLNLTQARIENYVKCPFSYYSKNILRLRETRTSDFDGRDVGNFMHCVFESFVTMLDGRSVKELDDGFLSELAERAARDYRASIVHGDTTDRLEFLFDRLIRLSKLFIENLVDEFRNSDFEPKFVEFPIDHEAGHISPLTVTLSNGRTISIYGRVDRVDSYNKNGNVYIRVVDYKTGDKNFSKEDIKLGLNMQMLIYMFSLCATDQKEFLDKVGCTDGGQLLPAGVLYYIAKQQNQEADSYNAGVEDDASKSREKIKRDGLLIDDIEILRAMEHDLGGRYIPVKMTQKGTFDRRYSRIEPRENFEELLLQIKEKIGEIGEEIISGRASASPLKNSRVGDPCRYCELKKLCRYSG